MEEKVAALKKQLSQITDKKERIKAIQALVWTTDDTFPDLGIIQNNQDLLNEAFELAIEINDKWGQALGYINKAYYGLYVARDAKMFDHFKTGIALFEEIGDKEKRSRTYYMMTYALWTMGKYDEALEYAMKGLKSAEESNDLQSLGWSNYALGVFYYDLKDYSNSQFYYKKAIDIFTGISAMKIGLARCLGGLGSVLLATNKFDEAVEYIQNSVKIYRELKNAMGESRALTDLGILFSIQNNHQEAEQLLKEGLDLRNKTNHHQGIITSCMELGRLYLKTKCFYEALNYLDKALELALSSDSKPKLFQIHELIGEVYKQTGDLAKALEHKEQFFKIKTEVTGEQATNKIKQLQTQFATERSEKEAEIHRLKNIELKKAYEEIEEKNKSILDSINYAKRIQHAILPTDTEIKKLFPDSFVLFIPKDVVSGDFYWVEKKDEKSFLAAVDCTGHGVPGAFMSMIGNTLLNEMVNEKGLNVPGEILTHLREGVIKALKQTGEAGENQDGMDIALCALSLKTDGKYQLEYAGANNPILILKNNVIQEIKADKQPIGIYHGDPKPFTNQIVELEKGDCIYLFSDGYADQVGGEKNKKFMYKRLQEMLIEYHKAPIAEQRSIYQNTIVNWKGNNEQVDDILFIGIRL